MLSWFIELDVSVSETARRFPSAGREREGLRAHVLMLDGKVGKGVLLAVRGPTGLEE